MIYSTTTFIFLVFFFFQAEDGIRDSSVTGVQTCALPILQLNIADLHSCVVLPVSARNFVLIALLELEHGELLAAALRDDLAAHRSFTGIGTQYHLLVVRVDGQYRAKTHFFPYLAINPLSADGVAGRDAILLSPGLNNGVHLSSKR